MAFSRHTVGDQSPSERPCLYPDSGSLTRARNLVRGSHLDVLSACGRSGRVAPDKCCITGYTEVIQGQVKKKRPYDGQPLRLGLQGALDFGDFAHEQRQRFVLSRRQSNNGSDSPGLPSKVRTSHSRTSAAMIAGFRALYFFCRTSSPLSDF